MENFGYEVDFDVMSCYPLIRLYKELETVWEKEGNPVSKYSKVYEYRSTPLNYQLTTSEITDMLTLSELLVDAYWAYQDYLSLKSKYDIIKSALEDDVPKHLVIKRHQKNRIN